MVHFMDRGIADQAILLPRTPRQSGYADIDDHRALLYPESTHQRGRSRRGNDDIGLARDLGRSSWLTSSGSSRAS